MAETNPTTKTCSAPDCALPVRARGLCSGCYQRARKDGTVALKFPRVAFVIGQRFGALIVESAAAELVRGDKKNHYRIRCRCECGSLTMVRSDCLRSGVTNSCGCLRYTSNLSHGDRRGRLTAPELKAWQHMIGRCYLPSDSSYRYYGGRGITVCERWRDSYGTFLADMGRRPSPRHSIDRVNNDGNYEPGNCRWATDSEQALNTRRSVRLTIDGITMPLGAWVSRNGLNSKAVLKRLARGWPADRAVSEPAQTLRHRKWLR